ncbi:MAG: MoxR family ATPase [Planctomycetales bacterium]
MPSTKQESPLLNDHDSLERIRTYLNATLKGKPEAVELVLICLLAQGHLLLEDRPGLGKTTLAKALADVVGGRFARVQCTPDLLPSDITGFSIYNQQVHQFEFRPGPVFSEVLLADEINRATPRTQSALLEAMAERQVTVDGNRHPLSEQFFVIATQNPFEQHGTYPLPEAQLDRFAMKLTIGYPSPGDELKLLTGAIEGGGKKPVLPTCLEAGQLARIQQQVATVPVVSKVQEYLVRLAGATRSHPHISLGMSPRGLLTWQRAAQARAYLNDRDFVTPEDVQLVALPVLLVRLGIEVDESENVIREILTSVAVP